MTDLSFDEVIVYAESCGKIPATDLMFHYASTGGNVPFPWGDAGPAKLEWKLGPVGQRSYDTRASEPRLLGLFSNALEWTLGPFPAFGRQSQTLSYDLKSTTVCGGPESALSAQVQPADWQRGAAISFDYLILKSHPLIGFRCARSVRPRLAPADFAEILPTDAVAMARPGPEHP